LDNNSRFIRLAGLCGSLRRGSYSAAILQSLRNELVAGAGLEIADIRLPLYNQDEDGATPDVAVQTLRRTIADADGLIIVTPEYNHGVPGLLKNALDWASRPGNKSVLQNKPVLVISNSPGFTGGVRAQAQLNETLLAVSAVILPGRQIVISNVAEKIKDGVFADKANIAFAMESVHRLIGLCRRASVAD